MYQHRFCIFWYFGVFFITLQNFAQNIVIVLKFSEKFNLNNSYTISKKEESLFVKYVIVFEVSCLVIY